MTECQWAPEVLRSKLEILNQEKGAEKSQKKKDESDEVFTVVHLGRGSASRHWIVPGMVPGCKLADA